MTPLEIFGLGAATVIVLGSLLTWVHDVIEAAVRRRRSRSSQ